MKADEAQSGVLTSGLQGVLEVGYSAKSPCQSYLTRRSSLFSPLSFKSFGCLAINLMISFNHLDRAGLFVAT